LGKGDPPREKGMRKCVKKQGFHVKWGGDQWWWTEKGPGTKRRKLMTKHPDHRSCWGGNEDLEQDRTAKRLVGQAG